MSAVAAWDEAVEAIEENCTEETNVIIKFEKV
jgi:hypothetical protein